MCSEVTYLHLILSSEYLARWTKLWNTHIHHMCVYTTVNTITFLEFIHHKIADLEYYRRLSSNTRSRMLSLWHIHYLVNRKNRKLSYVEDCSYYHIRMSIQLGQIISPYYIHQFSCKFQLGRLFGNLYIRIECSKKILCKWHTSKQYIARIKLVL